MSSELFFVIPWLVRPKKNSRRIVKNGKTGKPMSLPSAAYMRWEKSAVAHLKVQLNNMRVRGNANGWEFPVCAPVNVACAIHVEDERRRDLPNLLEGPLDELVKAG